MPCPACGHELTTGGCVNRKCPDKLPAKWGCSESGFGPSRDPVLTARANERTATEREIAEWLRKSFIDATTGESYKVGYRLEIADAIERQEYRK